MRRPEDYADGECVECNYSEGNGHTMRCWRGWREQATEYRHALNMIITHQGTSIGAESMRRLAIDALNAGATNNWRKRSTIA